MLKYCVVVYVIIMFTAFCRGSVSSHETACLQRHHQLRTAISPDSRGTESEQHGGQIIAWVSLAILHYTNPEFWILLSQPQLDCFVETHFYLQIMNTLHQADEDLSYGQMCRVIKDVNNEMRKERKSVRSVAA